MTSQAPVVDWPREIANLGLLISKITGDICKQEDPAKQAKLEVQQEELKVQQAKLELQQARNANLPEEEILELKGELKEAAANLKKTQEIQGQLQKGN